jgi:putative transcriptional regulator
MKNKLKYFRHKHEMNQKEFADYLGVNYQLYNRWEKQARQPNVDNIVKLCKKLNCSVEELFDNLPG